MRENYILYYAGIIVQYKSKMQTIDWFWKLNMKKGLKITIWVLVGIILFIFARAIIITIS